jgi:two-component system, OmpR family, sensor histidine kinase KdpD
MSISALPARARKAVMVCLGDSPAGNATLLRKASRAAGELNSELYAIHVETSPSGAAARENLGRLLDSVMLAAEMDAEVIWLRAPDVCKALLEFAADARVTRIVIGRSRPGFGSRLRHGSLTRKVIEQGRHFEIEVVAHAERE